MTDTPATNHRLLGIALSLAAAACLLYGAFTRTWLLNVSHFEEIGFGLRSNYDCTTISETERQCTERSNAELITQMRGLGSSAARDTSSAFAPLGWVTLVASLLAALGLLGGAALAAARRRPDLAMSPSTLALLGVMAGLITGCVFIATKPGPAGYVGVGIGFWSFGIGCVLGIAGAQMLAKVNRPEDPDLMHDTMNPDQF